MRICRLGKEGKEGILPSAVYYYRLLADKIMDKHVIINNFIRFTIPSLPSPSGCSLPHLHLQLFKPVDRVSVLGVAEHVLVLPEPERG